MAEGTHTTHSNHTRTAVAAVLLAGLFALVSAGAAAGATVSVKPVADAYVTAAKPKANYGRKRTLLVGGQGRSLSYLRFELPVASPILGAVLELRSRGSL